MRKIPWHSRRQGETVYHDNKRCTEGNKIEVHYLAAGTGDRPLCKQCIRLNAEDKVAKSEVLNLDK